MFCAVGSPHDDPDGAADPRVDLTSGVGESSRTPPLRYLLGIDPCPEDHSAWCVEHAFQLEGSFRNSDSCAAFHGCDSITGLQLRQIGVQTVQAFHPESGLRADELTRLVLAVGGGLKRTALRPGRRRPSGAFGQKVSPASCLRRALIVFIVPADPVRQVKVRTGFVATLRRQIQEHVRTKTALVTAAVR